MTDPFDPAAAPVRAIVVSGSESAARTLAEGLTAAGGLVAEPAASDAPLDGLDARRVDCVVVDHTHAAVDGSAVHERIRRETDVPAVAVVAPDDWERASDRYADDRTLALPTPPAGRLVALGESIRTAVPSRRRARALEQRQDLQRFLWDLVDDLVTAPTRDAIVERVCEQLAGSDHFGGVWVCGRGPDHEIRATAGLEPDRIERYHDILGESPDAPWRHAATELTGAVYPGPDADPDGGGADAVDVTVASVPLHYRGIVYGVVNVARERRGDQPPLAAAVDPLENVGKLVGQALATAEMQTQGETIQRAIEQADPAIAIIAADGTVEYVNAAFESVYGYTKSEAIGSTIAVLVPEDVDPERLLSSVREGATWHEEIVKEGKAGRRFYADLSVAAVPVEGGTRRKYVAVASDITSLKEREQRLEVLNRVLRHNLRNDMNAIEGYAALLADDASDAGAYAERIQDLAADLVAIGEKAREIETIVDTTRDRRTVRLETVIRRAVEAVRSVDPATQLRLEVAADAGDCGVPGAVLTPVVRELLENAVRHNDADDPRVDVAATVEADSDRPVTIRVADNGPGIPSHELTAVQEGTETALEHGSGLGLWLVTWGVRAVNGRVEFDENEPRGTVARLRIPST